MNQEIAEIYRSKLSACKEFCEDSATIEALTKFCLEHKENAYQVFFDNCDTVIPLKENYQRYYLATNFFISSLAEHRASLK